MPAQLPHGRRPGRQRRRVCLRYDPGSPFPKEPGRPSRAGGALLPGRGPLARRAECESAYAPQAEKTLPRERTGQGQGRSEDRSLHE
jgi:hypothetical protein